MHITKRSFAFAIFLLTTLLILTSYTLVRAADNQGDVNDSLDTYEHQT